MSIVSANESAYRHKIRRRLTLDLFTRYGTFWTYVEILRDEWSITPSARVPSTPVYGYGHIPFRFHLPDEPPNSPQRRLCEFIQSAIDGDDPLHRLAAAHILDLPWQPLEGHEPSLRAARWLTHLERLWSLSIPEDIRDGTNAGGWTPWLPFLSACVMYDPPLDRLLNFADHAAVADIGIFPAWKNPSAVVDAALHLQRYFETGDELDWDRSIEAHVASWQPSSKSPIPTGSRGRPSDPLQDVQCALWRHQGLSSADIARRIDRGIRDNADAYEPGTPSYRERSDAAEDAVKRGIIILNDRNAWARIIGE